MKLIAVFVISMFVVQSMEAQNKIPKIDGEWHVIGTTFPMWKKGNKLHPRFVYTPLGVGLWKDEVMYETKTGKTKTIKGKDKLQAETPPSFKWRGDGWLGIAVSKWQIDYVSPDGGLMLISFEKTAFTPAGADIISRKKSLHGNEKEKMLQVLKEKFGTKWDSEFVWLQ